MDQTLARVAWAGLYLLLTAGPLLLMLVGASPSGRGFWIEFSLALGFLGLAQLIVQFSLVARFRRLTAPYGIDAIMYYHRQIGVLAVLVILLHPAFLVWQNPAAFGRWTLLIDDVGYQSGIGSVVALLLIILLSYFRRQLRLNYEVWRVSHLAFALAAVGLAVVHVAAIGPYVEAGWKRSFWAVFAGCGIASLVLTRLIKPLLQYRRPYRVTDVRAEAEGVWSMAIEPEGHVGLSFAPGQFAWVTVGHPFRFDEHPFSFSSSAEQPGRIEFGIKEVGDFTRGLAQIRPGTRVFLDGPHGALSIDRFPSAGYVFIARGIGIVPFISMLRTMSDRDDRRPVLLIYAGRHREQLAYRAEIDSLVRQEGAPALRTVYVLKEPSEDWDGEVGRITRELLERRLPHERIVRDVLICGPDVMITGVEKALASLGVPRARVHSERFDFV